MADSLSKALDVPSFLARRLPPPRSRLSADILHELLCNDTTRLLATLTTSTHSNMARVLTPEFYKHAFWIGYPVSATMITALGLALKGVLEITAERCAVATTNLAALSKTFTMRPRVKQL